MRTRRVARFLRQEQGSVLLETAIVIPIMLLIFLAMAEFSQAYTARRKVASVASATADLVAQQMTITTAQLNDIVSISNALMAPLPTNTLQVTLSSIRLNDEGVTTAIWTCTWSNPAGTPVCTTTPAATSLPGGMIVAGESIIAAQTRLTYRPPISQFLTGNIVFEEVAYYKPRVTLAIPLQ